MVCLNSSLLELRRAAAELETSANPAEGARKLIRSLIPIFYGYDKQIGELQQKVNEQGETIILLRTQLNEKMDLLESKWEVFRKEFPDLKALFLHTTQAQEVPLQKVPDAEKEVPMPVPVSVVAEKNDALAGKVSESNMTDLSRLDRFFCKKVDPEKGISYQQLKEHFAKSKPHQLSNKLQSLKQRGVVRCDGKRNSIWYPVKK